MILMLAQGATQTGDESYILWGWVLLAVAVGLLFLEFLIPSGGLIGLLCGIAAIGSVVSFFMYDSLWGTVALCSYIILGPIVVIFMFRFFMSSPLADRLVLGAKEDPLNLTPEEAVAAAEQERQARVSELKQLIGAQGVAVTSLRPVGTIKIGDRRVDGMAESGTIEAGTPVIVTDVYDNQIKVRPT
ncbi:MAG: hypothetical protein JSV91_06265 [Phycisphaerales bacterium]|nr:MAG: hypothetical protein JSV91_06265 [Phycisphaerales bacterium]